MTYRESLSPWAIARLLPNNLQWVIIARYRNRSDADGHLQLLRRRAPQIRFEVIWDLPGGTGNRVCVARYYLLLNYSHADKGDKEDKGDRREFY
ncbi:MAG: hypothetical protein WA919_25290 [Coleofasciculaceae cyanobacterium]